MRSSEEHWLILRDFVRSLLFEIEANLLVEGVDIDETYSTVNRIGLGFDDLLNNPFDRASVSPIKNHLSQKHWNFFLGLLRSRKQKFVAMLGEPPNSWTKQQATKEWRWQVKSLERLITAS